MLCIMFGPLALSDDDAIFLASLPARFVIKAARVSTCAPERILRAPVMSEHSLAKLLDGTWACCDCRGARLDYVIAETRQTLSDAIEWLFWPGWLSRHAPWYTRPGTRAHEQ